MQYARESKIVQEHQPNLRIAAARAFQESLDQLQNILAQESQTSEPTDNTPDKDDSSSGAVPRSLEEAVADIDEFFGDA